MKSIYSYQDAPRYHNHNSQPFYPQAPPLQHFEPSLEAQVENSLTLLLTSIFSIFTKRNLLGAKELSVNSRLVMDLSEEDKGYRVAYHKIMSHE